MKKALTTMTCIAMLGGSATLRAQDPVPIDVGAGVDLVSDYVWRGQLLTDDPVIQPYVEAGISGLTLNIWGSIDTTDINETGNEDYRVQEVDYSLGYGYSPTEGLDLSLGAILYDFPGTAFNATTELYLGASLSSIPLAPSATVYYDVDEVEGMYASFGVGHSFGLSEQLSLSLGLSLGWGDSAYNDAYFGVDEGALNDLAVSVSLDYAVSETFSLSTYAGFSELVGSDIEDAVADSDILSAGVGFYFAF